MNDNMMSFQGEVSHWAVEVFGERIATNVPTRCYRFSEEAVELTQALGMTKEQWLLILDYVYGRPVGEPSQEVGGVMVTLAALCAATGINLHMSAWNEHERCKRPEVMEKIRAKQKNKPNPEDVLPAAVSPVRGSTYTHADGRRLIYVANHPLDGALLIFNEEDNENDDIMTFIACEQSALREFGAHPRKRNLRHTDDEAVDQFAEAMRSKMAAARAKGRSGWDNPEDCGVSYLQELLVGHVYKGDPIDVANLCMMLWHRGGRTVVEDQWVFDNTGKWPARSGTEWFKAMHLKLPITLEGPEVADSRLSSDGVALVNPRAKWKRITADTPRGVKLQLINKKAGVAHYSTLDSTNDFYTHYCELPVFDKDEE